MAIAQRKDVSDAERKHAVKEYGNVKYADEKNKKYPIDCGHVKSAWDYINKAKNAAKYSPDEVKSMKAKIVAAMKHCGHDVAEPVKKSLDLEDLEETRLRRRRIFGG